MDISIIIVNYNTKKLLQSCLDSLFKFTKGINFEVITIDNASSDSSQQMVKKKFPQVKLLANSKNLGFSKANNQGIAKSKGKYIFLLNSDAYLTENSIKKLFIKAEDLKNLGAIGPLLLNEDKSTQQSVGFFPSLPQILWWMSFIDDLPFGTFLRPYHVDHDRFYRKEQQVDWVTGAAIFASREAINKVGKLDEKIFMYGEDVEWCYRLKQAGFDIIFSPITKIVHIGRGSSNQISTSAIVGEYEGIIYFYKKHKNKASLQIASFLLKMGAILRFSAFSITGRKVLAKSYEKAFKVN